MYCEKCNWEGEGNFCPWCGNKAVSEKSYKQEEYERQKALHKKRRKLKRAKRDLEEIEFISDEDDDQSNDEDE